MPAFTNDQEDVFAEAATRNDNGQIAELVTRRHVSHLGQPPKLHADLIKRKRLRNRTVCETAVVRAGEELT